MELYNNFVYGFLIGSISKIIDDILDIYGEQNINKYLFEFLKIFMIIIFVLTCLYENFFIYIYLFLIFFPVLILPDAYTTEPYWGIITILILLFTLYKVIFHFNFKLIKLIILYFFIFYIQWFSAICTEVGEWSNIKSLQKYFPKLYPYFFLDEDVEISKKKLFFRLLNIFLCIYMLILGNNQIINYFNIENKDFISILPITSLFILAYNFVSVINQSYMIFGKNIKKQIIHKQVNGFFGIEKENKEENKEDNKEENKEENKEQNKEQTKKNI
jgi:hypothetical protein